MAIKLTGYCVAKNWIDDSKFAWCSYAIEKQIGASIFFVITLIIALIFSSFVETISFAAVFYIFRSRMGGWHAKHAWSCQMISTGITVLVILLIGPAIERINPFPVLIANFVLIAGMLIIKPVYPLQVHFTQEEMHANYRQKNKMLLILSLIQAISCIFISSKITIYSFLGLIATAITVVLEYITQFRKDGADYESD